MPGSSISLIRCVYSISSSQLFCMLEIFFSTSSVVNGANFCSLGVTVGVGLNGLMLMKCSLIF